MSSNPSSSNDSCGEQQAEGDLSQLRETARRLVDAIAAEPVPERLRELEDRLELRCGKATIIMWSTDGSAAWLAPWTWFTAARWDRIGGTF